MSSRSQQGRAAAGWERVRAYALALPGVVEETSRAHAAWLVNKKFFVWERPLRKSDLAALGDAAPTGPILGVRTADLEMKEALLRNDPRALFTTPHFDGYPAVLVQLDKSRPKPEGAHRRGVARPRIRASGSRISRQAQVNGAASVIARSGV